MVTVFLLTAASFIIIFVEVDGYSEVGQFMDIGLYLHLNDNSILNSVVYA